MAVTHDDNYFDVMEITGESPEILSGVIQSGVLLEFSDGEGPAFFAPEIVRSGVTVGVLYGVLPFKFIFFAEPLEVLCVEYFINESGKEKLIGLEEPTFVTSDFSNKIGTSNGVWVPGFLFPAAFQAGVIQLVPVMPSPLASQAAWQPGVGPPWKR